MKLSLFRYQILHSACISGSIGPPGPQGFAGGPGPVGGVGQRGVPGSVGPAGQQGATGSSGLSGSIGPRGEPGESMFHVLLIASFIHHVSKSQTRLLCLITLQTRRPASAHRTARAANFRRDLEAT